MKRKEARNEWCFFNNFIYDNTVNHLIDYCCCSDEVCNKWFEKRGRATSNEVKTSVKEGKLELKLVSVDATDGIVESGYSYRYILYATNKSDIDMKNVEISYNTNNDSKMSKIFYINDKPIKWKIC